MTAEAVDISPLDVDVAVTITHEPGDEYSAFRCLHADVQMLAESPGDEEFVGTLDGWIAHDDAVVPIDGVGDGISQNAGHLAETAAEILVDHGGSRSDAVVMIDQVELVEKWRRGDLIGLTVKNLVYVLQLDPSTTIAVIDPKYLAVGDSLPADGPERDVHITDLQHTCRAAGFEQWGENAVFWRGFELRTDG